MTSTAWWGVVGSVVIMAGLGGCATVEPAAVADGPSGIEVSGPSQGWGDRVGRETFVSEDPEQVLYFYRRGQRGAPMAFDPMR